ncbi:hypothetical protein ACFFWD_15895 [Bradyrhizobium erythrophlei]|uniref:hypothetical protein n=1 Tax=Bradyrhizobium erythrophlei TaxID=1437360 RepID=UPI0035E55EF9
MNIADEQLTTAHRAKLAYVYVRQSSVNQVRQHHESSELQYRLINRAIGLGWPPGRVRVIDADRGKSGAGGVDRHGFQKLIDQDRPWQRLSCGESRCFSAWPAIIGTGVSFSSCARVFGVLIADGERLYDAAADQLEQESCRLERQRVLRAERARDEAERARRQYDADEPENRLLARSRPQTSIRPGRTKSDNAEPLLRCGQCPRVHGFMQLCDLSMNSDRHVPAYRERFNYLVEGDGDQRQVERTCHIDRRARPRFLGRNVSPRKSDE